MSDTYDLVCHDCRKRIWIGQSGNPLYYGAQKLMDILCDFLIDHQGHYLGYVNTTVIDVYDYDEVK